MIYLLVLSFKVNEDPVRTERELSRIKTVLEVHCQLLYQSFSYYSVSTAIYGHMPHTAMWNQAAYSSFYTECKIALRENNSDGTSLGTAMSYIDNIFLVATMDVPKSDPVLSEKGSSQLAAQLSAVDLGKGKGALLRYGFVATIVRLAVAIFKEEAAVSPAWAVERLVAAHLMPSLPPLARCVPDDFRTHKLYAPEVEEVYRKHLPWLRFAFKHYSGRDSQGISQMGELISLDEFVKLCSEGDLLDSGLTRREAGFAFVHSQMFVADEARRTASRISVAHSPPSRSITCCPTTTAVARPPRAQVKRREKLLLLTFEGFLEALARLTLFKAMPTASQVCAMVCLRMATERAPSEMQIENKYVFNASANARADGICAYSMCAVEYGQGGICVYDSGSSSHPHIYKHAPSLHTHPHCTQYT